MFLLEPINGEHNDRGPLFFRKMVAIKEDTLTLGQELGQGEFGSVLRGTYRGPDGKVLDVAVKTLRVDAMGHGEQVSGYGTWGTGEWVWDVGNR